MERALVNILSQWEMGRDQRYGLRPRGGREGVEGMWAILGDVSSANGIARHHKEVRIRVWRAPGMGFERRFHPAFLTVNTPPTPPPPEGGVVT